MLKYASVKENVENDFIHPHFNKGSGLEPDEIYDELVKIYELGTRNKSMMLVRAEMIKFILENIQIEINPQNIFAEKVNDGTTYEPFAQWDGIGERILRNVMRPRVLSKEMPEKYERRDMFYETGCASADADYWHTIPHFHDLLTLGITGIIERAENAKSQKEQSGTLTPEQHDFYDSVIISYNAMITLMKRLYAESLKFDIPYYSACLEKLIVQKPDDLYEALVLTYIYIMVEEIGCERARCLGRIDIHYYPFYKKSLENGASEEEIKELFRFFFAKFHAARRFANQPYDLCGSELYGIKGENELTYLILDVWSELGFDNPKLHIHYHNDMPKNILEKCMGLIRSGVSSMVIVNDETVFKAYEKIGIQRDESKYYEILGCYEPLIPNIEEPCIGGSWLNMAKAMELVFTCGTDKRTGYRIGPATPDDYATFEEFYNGYITQLDSIVDFVTDYIVENSKLNMKINPSPVYSGCNSFCIEYGRDIFNRGAKYSNTSVKFFGTGTVTDSLEAVKKFVFDEKRITYRELRDAVIANWEGREALRLEILKDREKFGCGIENVDYLAKRVITHLTQKLLGKPNGIGGVWRIGVDSIDHCIIFGKNLGATPDGRYDGEATSKNLSATLGADREGITSLINSATCFDHTDFCDAAVLDFLLHPSSVRGDDGINAMMTMAEVYFMRGGMALQGNVLSTEQLLEAQKDPQKYPTLQVRVCGWNEYFNAMSKEMQDSFIRQVKM